MLQSATSRRALALAAISIVACAEAPDDPDSYEDELASSDEYDEPAVLHAAINCDPARPRTCGMTRATPEQARIWEERGSLPADVQSSYFSRQLTGVGTTPDGRANFQFYEGALGRGAIYTVNEGWLDSPEGTYAIYGSILALWEQNDYERGLGYPTGGRIGNSQPFRLRDYSPSPQNGGLVKGTVVITDLGNGQASWQENRYYQSGGGHYTGPLVSSPQQCKYIPSFTCAGHVSAWWIEPLDPLAPEGQLLWCGPEGNVCSGGTVTP